MEDQSKFQINWGSRRRMRGDTGSSPRSNSVTAAVQADLDMPDMLDSPLDSPETDMPFSGSVSRKYSREAATSPASASTVSIQGSGTTTMPVPQTTTMTWASTRPSCPRPTPGSTA
ncbi:hypothetical protein J4Q44_G00270100 [Coregonus suidteri]|uniref:Uncharacterized protein n=1 Tax=Coregonus suidteri TaxID=861788 RepID=A0AAN8L6H8_9TELE